MTQLIPRLESATQGSRELDLEIARLMGVVVMRHNRETGRNEEYTHWHYTTNLQDALALIPDGFAWRVKATNIEGAMEYSGQVNYEKPSYAPTPALALCIAALKARGGGAIRASEALFG